jgi:GNAT superfamily N-acetyltransferase
MSDIQYCLATGSDIHNLVDARVAFLTELMGPQTDEQIDLLKQHLEKYFNAAINDQTYICWLAIAGERIVGWGGMAIRVNPGSFKNPSGLMGYIMNMYTVPDFRNKGIATSLLNKLVETGREMGITAFELHATKEGEPVYMKYGFEKHVEPTYRKYY